MNLPKKHSQVGFTLIEMIVSLALFSVVLTISIGSMLTLVATNGQLQSEQSVMTNITFALDSMTREIRTGTNYYCDSGSSVNAGPSNRKIFLDGATLIASPVKDCSNGNNSGQKFTGLSFIESGQSITGAPDTRIVYYFDNDSNSPNQGKIMRRISGQNAQPIISSGIVIEEMEFYVSGSKPFSAGGGDSEDQAAVTIYIKAYEARNSTKKYDIQTTVTQRILDI